MARAHTIYLLREKDSCRPVALFTVKYEAISFAVRHGFHPDTHALEGYRDGQMSVPRPVVEWETLHARPG